MYSGDIHLTQNIYLHQQSFTYSENFFLYRYVPTKPADRITAITTKYNQVFESSPVLATTLLPLAVTGCVLLAEGEGVALGSRPVTVKVAVFPSAVTVIVFAPIAATVSGDKV